MKTVFANMLTRKFEKLSSFISRGKQNFLFETFVYLKTCLRQSHTPSKHIPWSTGKRLPHEAVHPTGICFVFFSVPMKGCTSHKKARNKQNRI